LVAEAKYRPEIDGLRAVAVVPVVLYHAGFAGFGGGFLGVDVFFVISGYLITRLIDAEIRRGDFSVVRFYERRVRRILPALYLVVVVSSLFAWLWLLPREFRDFGRSVVAIALFGSNVYFNQAIGYFTQDVELWPLIHTWSLAVEEQFYAAFPLLLLLLRRAAPRWTFAGVATLSALTLLWAQWESGADPQTDFYLPQFRAWELGAGALVALAAPKELSLDPKVRWSLAGLGAVLLFASLAFAPRDLTPSLSSLAPVGGTALLIAFAAPDNTWGRLLGTKPLVGIGLISYSAYLWHQPLFAFARFRFDAAPASLAMALLGVASFALAYFSWRFVERPFRDRKRLSRTFVFVAALAVGVIFIVTGRVTIIEHGFARRMPSYVDPLDYMGAYRETCLDVADLRPATLAASQTCRLGRRDAPPDFLLIGDSHAAALGDGLDLAAKAAGRSGIVLGSNACLPILDVSSYYPPNRASCRKQHHDLLNLVETLGVRLVVMHARWEALDESLQVDDEPTMRTATGDDLEQRLLRTLSAFNAAGVKVVIVTSTPRSPYIVPDILQRKALYRLDIEERSSFRQFLFENRTAFRFFSDPEVRHHAKVLDLYPFFCDGGIDGRCKVADGGRPYLFDKDHLSLFGSTALAPILEQVFE
jgi:peptidoglycan/LPS O-acetylase OafA/YrhL